MDERVGELKDERQDGREIREQPDKLIQDKLWLRQVIDWKQTWKFCCLAFFVQCW